jgi:hypothetical protein
MSTKRALHTATPLLDGRVLVVGGANGENSALASAEIYDPKSQGFTSAGSLIAARKGHTATRLLDGRVLVVGGADDKNAALASAESYDPKTNRFTSAASLTAARTGHATTLLSDGRVLVVGGKAEAGAEVYDPKNNSFALAGLMSTPRASHTATALPDGAALVAGGEGIGALLASSELFQLQSPGFECVGSAECHSYACLDGVCCDTICDAVESCNTCARDKGAPADGTCSPLHGRSVKPLIGASIEGFCCPWAIG